MTSLDLLTDRLFDYAGMFPPAALPFEEALSESAALPRTLGRPALLAADFVLTPEHLESLTSDAVKAAGFERPCTICLVGVPAAEAAHVAAAVKAFNRDRAGSEVPQRIVSLELHFDDGLPAEAVDGARRLLGQDVQVYVEPKVPDAALAERLPDVMAALDALDRDAGGAPAVGLKVRCAGPTALSHNTLAAVIAAVARRRMPFKATQGLHHPFAMDPRYENEHGFLNVAAALRLAQALELGADEVAAILRDPEPADFVFDNGLGWKTHRILTQRVQEGAQRVPFSIGSCSLDEPDDDLAAMLGS